MKRDTILIIISVIFLAISGYILYSNFFAIPGSIPFNLPLTTEVNSQLNVQALENQVDSSIKNLGPAGTWNKLESSEQYQGLSAEANIDIDIGNYGLRVNPFLPLKYSTSTNAE